MIYTTTVQGAVCLHLETYWVGAVDPTCTSAGYTGDAYCLSCNVLMSSGTPLPMLDHSYANGACTSCGAPDPNAPSVDPEVPAGTYVKVTSAPANWEGTYLIVYENGTSAMVFNGKDAVNGYVSASISDHTIAASDALDAVAVTVEAMTGGYGNSYAQSVGQQTYQGYLQQLGDRVPELYRLALDQYNTEGQAMYDQASLIAGMENQDYGRYRDQVADYYTELDRLTSDSRYQAEQDYGRWSDDMGFQYQQGRDAIADAQWQALFDEAKRQYDEQMALS